MRLLPATFATLSLLLASFAVRAEDWPQWRGPRGDGISRETGLAETWPAEGPKAAWSIKVGTGFASPIAVDGKVYMFAVVGEQEVLYALDADTGKTIWQQPFNAAWTSSYGGSRATPTIEGTRIYTYGGQGDLICRELADGAIVWHVNVLQQIGATPLQWGEASSPLIDGDSIYVQGGFGGSTAVCIDKKTGKLLWKSQATGGGYAHTILIDPEGRKQLIAFGQKAVYSVDPASGKTIWSQEWITSNDVNAATPIYRDGHLFITSGYARGCMMLNVTASTASVMWEKKGGSSKNPTLGSRFQPPILDGDFIYGSSEGLLTCMSWPDGAVKWQSKDSSLRLGIGGSLVRVGDKLIALSELGKLLLLKATPEGVEKISEARGLVEGRQVWSTPLIYKGKVYLKGTDDLVCANIAK